MLRLLERELNLLHMIEIAMESERAEQYHVATSNPACCVISS